MQSKVYFKTSGIQMSKKLIFQVSYIKTGSCFLLILDTLMKKIYSKAYVKLL